MRLRSRIQKAEERAAERGRVPFLITIGDRSFAAGMGDTTREEWEARYGAQIERERGMGREVFGIDFTAPGETGEPDES